MNLKSRLKNYGLWAAVFAFIPLLAESLKVYNLNLILPSNYEMLVKSLLGILILFGLLNNPTTENQGFGDDKQE